MRSLLALTIALAMTATSQAQPIVSKEWVGISGLWGSPSSWNPSGVPGSGDVAGFAATGEAMPVVNGSFAIGSLHFAADAQAYFISGGTLTVSGVGGYGLNSIATANSQFIDTALILNSNNQIWRVDGTQSVTVSGSIGQAVGQDYGIEKTGSQTLVLSGANTYTGGTTISAGTVELGSSDVMADAGDLTLNGGTFSSAGFSDTMDDLIVSTGTIALGTGVHTLTFDTLSNPTGLLTITGWTATGGNPFLGGDQGKIFLTGVAPGTFFSNVLFDGGFAQGAAVLATGELAPVPEPTTTLAVAGLGLVGLRAVRRRLAKPAVA